MVAIAPASVNDSPSTNDDTCGNLTTIYTIYVPKWKPPCSSQHCCKNMGSSVNKKGLSQHAARTHHCVYYLDNLQREKLEQPWTPITKYMSQCASLHKADLLSDPTCSIVHWKTVDTVAPDSFETQPPTAITMEHSWHRTWFKGGGPLSCKSQHMNW
jgi:hypothetical protein